MGTSCLEYILLLVFSCHAFLYTIAFTLFVHGDTSYLAAKMLSLCPFPLSFLPRSSASALPLTLRRVHVRVRVRVRGGYGRSSLDATRANGVRAGHPNCLDATHETARVSARARGVAWRRRSD